MLRTARHGGCPWLVGGDFNRSPARALAALRALGIDGVAIALPDSHDTCFAHVSGRFSNLHHFICDPILALATDEIEAVLRLPVAPHLSVRWLLRGAAQHLTVRAFRAPAVTPAQPDLGPHGKPPSRATAVDGASAFLDTIGDLVQPIGNDPKVVGA